MKNNLLALLVACFIAQIQSMDDFTDKNLQQQAEIDDPMKSRSDLLNFPGIVSCTIGQQKLTVNGKIIRDTYQKKMNFHGNKVTTEYNNFDLAGIKKVKLTKSMVGLISLVAANDARFEITAETSFMDKITPTVKQGTLSIDLKESYDGKDPISVVLRLPNIETIACDFADATIAGQFNNLIIKLKTYAKVNLKGSAFNLIAKAQGNSDVMAVSDFSADDAVVEATGASRIRVRVNKTLSMTARGCESLIFFAGDADIKKRVCDEYAYIDRVK